MKLSIKLAVLILILIVVLANTTATALALSMQSDWATTETAHFKIYAPKRADLKRIGSTAETIYVYMAKRYRYEQTQKIRLYIYTNRPAFLDGSPSENAVGFASPSNNAISILLGTGDSGVTLAHEVNHIIFLQSIPRIDTVPVWFIEGLAVYESQPGVEVIGYDERALVNDIPELVDPKSKPKLREAEPGDYTQGYRVVHFIADKYGRAKLYEAIYRMQAGEDFNTALTRAIGTDEKKINDEWRAYARQQIIKAWVMRLQDAGWYILSAVLILALIALPLKRRKQLRQLEEMEEDEEAIVDK